MENKLPILVFDMNKPGNLVAPVRPKQGGSASASGASGSRPRRGLR